MSSSGMNRENGPSDMMEVDDGVVEGGGPGNPSQASVLGGNPGAEGAMSVGNQVSGAKDGAAAAPAQPEKPKMDYDVLELKGSLPDRDFYMKQFEHEYLAFNEITPDAAPVVDGYLETSRRIIGYDYTCPCKPQCMSLTCPTYMIHNRVCDINCKNCDSHARLNAIHQRNLTLEMMDTTAPSWNVICRSDLKKNDFLGAFTGVLKLGQPNPLQPYALPDLIIPKPGLSQRVYVDAAQKGNFLRFLMDDQKDPNTYYRTVINDSRLEWQIRALKDIPRKTELTIRFPQNGPMSDDCNNP